MGFERSYLGSAVFTVSLFFATPWNLYSLVSLGHVCRVSFREFKEFNCSFETRFGHVFVFLSLNLIELNLVLKLALRAALIDIL